MKVQIFLSEDLFDVEIFFFQNVYSNLIKNISDRAIFMKREVIR